MPIAPPDDHFDRHYRRLAPDESSVRTLFLPITSVPLSTLFPWRQYQPGTE